MRPHQLTVQAFGPFAQKETLDFDQLGTQPLFLIYGATGAGKSSVLDAVCFALYGQTAIKERDATQMRCHFTQTNLVTQIELVFSLGEKKYRVERMPTQERDKTRGEGTTVQQTRATLWTYRDDQEILLVARSASETTQMIEELTGLNAEQFRQIMVLPQGKFREFLMADSNQREAIFARLFQTQIYSQVEEQLKQQATIIRKQIDNQVNRKIGVLHSVELDDSSKLNDELERIEDELAHMLRQKDVATQNLRDAEARLERAKLLDRQFTELNESEKELASLTSQQPAFAGQKYQLAAAQAADKIAPHYTDVIEANKAIAQLQKKIVQAKHSAEQLAQEQVQQLSIFIRLEERYKTCDDLNKELQTLQSQLPKFNRLHEQREKLTAAQGEVDRLHKDCQSNKAQLDKHLAQLQTLEESLQELQRQINEKPGLQQQLSLLESCISSQKTLCELQQEEQINREQLRQLTIDKENAIVHRNEQQRQLKKMEHAWYSGQAARLAEELRIDEPCPVCGSIEHPEPASRQGNLLSVTTDELENEKHRYNETTEKVHLAENAASQCTIRLETIISRQHEVKTQLGEFSNHSLEENLTTLERTRQSVLRLEKAQQQFEQHQQRRAHIVDTLKQLEQTGEQLQQAFHTTTLNSSLLRQACELLEKDIPAGFENKEKLEARITSLREEINDIKNSYHVAKQNVDQMKERQVVLATQISEQENFLQHYHTAKSNAEKQWHLVLNSSPFTTAEEFEQAKLSEDTQSALSVAISQYEERLTRVTSKVEHMRTHLSNETKPELQKMAAELQLLQADAHATSERWTVADNRARLLTNVKQKLEKIDQAVKQLDDEYAIVGTLSDVASGQNSAKISLQRFVLSVLLDEVLIEASLRLYQMSSGRYQLIRKDQRSKGNRASGLELEVDDAFTGIVRPVSTLSGGESFIAALSLALGLSDVVQAYSGGIKLDTLFVDEGFGSLDQESLEQAIKVLIQLQASGRMIGIISHVNELFEQMPLRVEVEKTMTGSHIKMSAVN